MNIELHQLFIPLAYLLGSLSSAIIVCKVMGLPDPRTEGSNNPGATNVLRIGGKKAAAITLVGDMLKGLIPVLAANLYGVEALVLALTALAAFLGHLYPIFFGFKGGKGVATALGVLIGIHWMVGGLTILTWLVMAKLFRISSLSALIATLLAPGYIYWLLGSLELTIASGVMTVILFWRHRSNIQNLLNGTESKIGKKD